MRIPDPIKTGPVMILWLLAGVFVFPQLVRAQATCAQQVADIDAYCKKIDRFIKANQHGGRVFSSTSQEPGLALDGWREFTTEGDPRREDNAGHANDNAYVWLNQGKIVGVNFTLHSESRDWVQYAMYYYREDGTLARINAQLKTSYGEMTVIRELFYDRKGVLLRGSTKSCNLKTSKERKPERDFIPEPLPRYLTTDRLPFYQVLGK